MQAYLWKLRSELVYLGPDSSLLFHSTTIINIFTSAAFVVTQCFGSAFVLVLAQYGDGRMKFCF
jgi:hypothetical protein